MGECYDTSYNFVASSGCDDLNKNIKVYLLHDPLLDDCKLGNSYGIVALSSCNACCHNIVSSLDE